jgi:DNA topoisomerase-1
LTPEEAKPFLTGEQWKLYELIWNRFVASQMASALYDTVEAEIEANGYSFKATGSVMKFDGFLRVYKVSAPPSKEEGNEEAKEGDVILPPLEEDQALTLLGVVPDQHFTKPPPRFTEASLVRELEKLGIGRPSTYATIVTKIQDRNYTSKVKGRLIPTELGFVVTDILVENFPDILNVTFTADMEADLDKIEEGDADWVETLRHFYSSFSRDLNKATTGMRVRPIETDVLCEKCGAKMVKKWWKNAFFLACSAYPECRNMKRIIEEAPGKLVLEGQETEQTCEKCGARMVKKWWKNASFLACSAYPECRNMKRIIEEAPGKLVLEGQETEQTDEKCELCGKPLVYRRSRWGRFLACSGFPECKYIKGKRTRDIDCPREGCGGKLVRRRTKKRQVFYGCSNYPKCKFAVWKLSDLDGKEQNPDSSE